MLYIVQIYCMSWIQNYIEHIREEFRSMLGKMFVFTKKPIRWGGNSWRSPSFWLPVDYRCVFTNSSKTTGFEMVELDSKMKHRSAPISAVASFFRCPVHAPFVMVKPWHRCGSSVTGVRCVLDLDLSDCRSGLMESCRCCAQIWLWCKPHIS